MPPPTVDFNAKGQSPLVSHFLDIVHKKRRQKERLQLEDTRRLREQRGGRRAGRSHPQARQEGKQSSAWGGIHIQGAEDGEGIALLHSPAIGSKTATGMGFFGPEKHHNRTDSGSGDKNPFSMDSRYVDFEADNVCVCINE